MIKVTYFNSPIHRKCFLFLLVILFTPHFSSKAQLVEYLAPVKLSSLINSNSEESMPLLSPDNKTLYFVRTLSEKNTNGRISGQDIWYSSRDEKGGWTEANNKLNSLNTKGNNAIIGFNPSGSKLYLLNTYRKGSFLNKGISFSELKNSLWTSPTVIPLKKVNPRSLFYGFYMHPSEKILIASMDAEESLGQEDLYVILKDTTGRWGDPVHLGSTINTSGFEIAPFLSEDGSTLYFSSNGHEGLGDADIYMSKRLYKSWNIWTKPVNLGKPINSEKFDAYFSLTQDSTIYFASNREGGLADIYQSKVIKQNIKEILQIDEIDEASASSSPASIKKNLLRVSEEKANEFLGVSIPRVVYFNVNSFEISPEDQELIYYIAGKLETTKKYYLEIVGHTDAEGSDAYNMDLSKKRAEAVKTSFLSMGVPANRMIIVGKGAKQPAVKNSPQNKKNDKNRRVEINFLE